MLIYIVKHSCHIASYTSLQHMYITKDEDTQEYLMPSIIHIKTPTQTMVLWRAKFLTFIVLKAQALDSSLDPEG